MGSRIAELRAREGMSRPDLARAAGVSTEYVRKLETGEIYRPSLAYLEKIAAALSSSVEAIAGEEIERDLAHGEPDDRDAGGAVMREIEREISKVADPEVRHKLLEIIRGFPRLDIDKQEHYMNQLELLLMIPRKGPSMRKQLPPDKAAGTGGS